MKTRIKDISLHCFNFMYKLYGRNTCAFGIEAELSVPAAGSQSDPYFNVNKRGISFISLSLSTNNKPEKSPFHFQLLARSWETEQGRARGSAGPRAPPRMDCKKKTKREDMLPYQKETARAWVSGAPSLWRAELGSAAGGRLDVCMTSHGKHLWMPECFPAQSWNPCSLDPFTEIRLRTLRGLPRGLI